MSRVKILVRLLAVLVVLIAGALLPPEPALAVSECSVACPSHSPRGGPNCICDSSCFCCIPGMLVYCGLCYSIC